MSIPSANEQIKEILEYFNFNKVHMVMCALDWKWYIQSVHDFRVPIVDEMKEHAEQLLNDVAAWSDSCVSCGGFQARSRGGLLSLEFVLTEWSVEVE